MSEEDVERIRKVAGHPELFRNAIWNYLKPRGRPAPRAHLFTINGLTYPLHKVYCFASVPDPHELGKQKRAQVLEVNAQRSKRRYSMLAYLHSVREGDLVFFFQADPQWPRDIFNRRGFRGMWIIDSKPFRDKTDIGLPSGYQILGSCPSCHTPFNFGVNSLEEGKKCPLCGSDYGLVTIATMQGTRKFSRVVLSARVLLKPLIVFKVAAGDNRVYGDVDTEPLLWISRADNAMGAGKGSSIRTLLPEEAAKIAYMLATEDSQEIDEEACSKKYPGNAQPIADHNCIEVKYPRVKKVGRDWFLEHEFHLNLYFSLHIDDHAHQLQSVLNMPLREVDYWTTEFPWGYTADTADFVVSCWNEENGRYRIYLFEFKKDFIDKKALAETLLYVPWVTRVMMLSRHETTNVEAVPVIVGRRSRINYLPKDYTLKLSLFGGRHSKNITVKTPLILEYEPVNIFRVKDNYSGNTSYYASDIVFSQKTLPTRLIRPLPATYTTTEVEKEWVVDQFLAPLWA
jgi:hypothetical protein